MRKLIADIAVRGLAIAKSPELLTRLHKLEWYGGTLRSMIEKLNLPQGAEVLEIGCGPGGLTRDLASAGYRVTGIDQSRPMIRRATRNQPTSGAVRFLQADALNMPLKTRQFEAVIAASLLNVVGNKKALISEMARVTQHNGIVMAIFPTPLFTKANAGAFAIDRNLSVFQSAAITAWAAMSTKLKENDVISIFETAGLESMQIDTALDGMLSSITGIRK
jgi:ubiquinone/menaquinone biosynthesis C-methylase UbiE